MMQGSNMSASAADAIQQNEFADLYSEVGPDNVGGMGNEPSCTLTLFSRHQNAPHLHITGSTATKQATGAANSPLADQPMSTSARSHVSDATAKAAHSDSLARQHLEATDEATAPVAVADDAEGAALSSNAIQPTNESLQSISGHASADDHARYHPVMQIGCSPHGVVATRPGHQQPMLLGLSNDVDCAVVAVSAANDGQQLHAQHVHSIPALAYVAAGTAHIPMCQSMYVCTAYGLSVAMHMLLPNPLAHKQLVGSSAYSCMVVAVDVDGVMMPFVQSHMQKHRACIGYGLVAR